MDDAESGQSIGAGVKAGDPGQRLEPSSRQKDVGLTVDIVRDTAEWHALGSGLDTAIESAARAAALGSRRLPERSAEMVVLLTCDARIKALNARFRGHDNPTNVLSFPFGDDAPFKAADDAVMLGDVVLAYETLRAQAHASAVPVLDHLSHLIVHGTLHLLGFDHESSSEARESSSEAREMEALERRILAGLGIADPYGGPAIHPAQAQKETQKGAQKTAQKTASSHEPTEQ